MICTLTPDDVKSKKGKLFVVCDCNRRSYLDGYGVAHLGVTDLIGKCEHCKRTIRILRSKDEE